MDESCECVEGRAACGVLFFSWHVQLLVLSKH
jgi:hypothetical protein